MYLGVLYLSIPRIWGSGLWSSKTDTSLQRKPGYGNWENTSHFWSLKTTTVEFWFFFFNILMKRSAWYMPAVPQLYKVNTSKTPPYQTWRQGSSSCGRLLAASGSSSCTPLPRLQGKFGPFAIPSSLPAPLIGPCTCSRAWALVILMNLRNLFTTKPLNLYSKCSDIKTWIFFL